jgi:putative copper export protein
VSGFLWTLGISPDVEVMTTALAPRTMLLWCLIAAGALMFAGVGHAAAAQRSTAPHRVVAVHHRAIAYADGSLTVARHSRRKRSVPLAHADVRTAVVVAKVAAQKKPVAYADGLLTVARHHARRRRILAHTA